MGPLFCPLCSGPIWLLFFWKLLCEAWSLLGMLATPAGCTGTPAPLGLVPALL